MRRATLGAAALLLAAWLAGGCASETSDDTETGDDGESGAGMIILQMLEREQIHNHIVVVTRWYGGKHLGGDRFKHVKHAMRHYFDHAKPK